MQKNPHIHFIGDKLHNIGEVIDERKSDDSLEESDDRLWHLANFNEIFAFEVKNLGEMLPIHKTMILCEKTRNEYLKFRHEKCVDAYVERFVSDFEMDDGIVMTSWEFARQG